MRNKKKHTQTGDGEREREKNHSTGDVSLKAYFFMSRMKVYDRNLKRKGEK